MRCSNDKSHNTALLRLDGDVLFFEAKMGVDADGSPLAKKNAGPTDLPDTSLRYPLPQKPSIDADKVPFIVIPLGGFGASLGVELGDVATVVHDGHAVSAIVADEGPTCKIGEGSIQLHELIDHPVCTARNDQHECEKIHDSSIETGVMYFIFPGSKRLLYPGLTPDNVNERVNDVAARLFDELRRQP
jgi:hypothetical protein